MADRVSVTIRIGGLLPRPLLDDLRSAIESEGAAIDWEGTQFSVSTLVPNEPLDLMAHEVAYGSFEEIEKFCSAHGLAFVRWSGGCAGSFGPERVVFDGTRARSFTVTEDDEVMISLDEIRHLGTMTAIEAHFAAADFAVPPLIVIDAGSTKGGNRS